MYHYFGLIFGILMALGYAGTIDINIYELLKAHIYLVLGGYVGITIMGMSLILLPMFWLSHSFTWKPVEFALGIMSLGVISVTLSSLFNSSLLELGGYGLSILALFLYFYRFSTQYALSFVH